MNTDSHEESTGYVSAVEAFLIKSVKIGVYLRQFLRFSAGDFDDWPALRET